MSTYEFKGSLNIKIDTDYPLSYNYNGCVLAENCLLTNEINTTSGNLTLGSSTGTINFGTGSILDFTDTTFIANPTTLQDTYNNSSSDKIILNNTISTFNIKDSIGGIGTNLFSVQNNAGNINYLNVNSSGIETTRLTVDNLRLDLNTISSTSGNINITPSGNLYLNSFLWPSNDGTSGQYLTTNGNKVLFFTSPLKQLTVSDNILSTSLSTYQNMLTFVYGGSKLWGVITNVYSVCELNKTDFGVRLYDYTNREVIAELDNINDGDSGPIIIELKDVKNIPENRAIFQFQMKKNSGVNNPNFYSGQIIME